MRSKWFLLLTSFGFWFILANDFASACRFNVRDVGFAQFGPVPYTMVGYVDGSISSDQKTIFQQVAFAALLDSNIEFQLVDLDGDPNNPALAYRPQAPLNGTPTLALISSEGNPFPISLEDRGQSFKDSVWYTIESVVVSPLRESIVQDVIRAYGVILMIEGMEESENRRVREIIQSVIEKVKNNLPDLPKAVDNPPVMHVLSRADFDREKILLWSLGVENKPEQPRVAVLYGRARRIGSVLSGEEITRDSLSGLASVIGLSCECGLDRSWMMGTMIPFRWTNEYSDEVAKKLGFDPDSPLVKTEISQILSVSAARNPSGTGGGSDVLMGYGEITVDIQDTESSDGEEIGSGSDMVSVSQEIGSLRDSANGNRDTIPLQPPSLPKSDIESAAISTSYNGVILIVMGLILISLLGGLFIVWKSRE